MKEGWNLPEEGSYSAPHYEMPLGTDELFLVRFLLRRQHAKDVSQDALLAVAHERDLTPEERSRLDEGYRNLSREDLAREANRDMAGRTKYLLDKFDAACGPEREAFFDVWREWCKAQREKANANP